MTYISACKKKRQVKAGSFSPSRLFNGLVAGVVLAGALVAVPSSVRASEIGNSENFGIGLVLGYPHLGLSINYFMTSSVSLQIDPALHVYHHYHNNDNLGIGCRVDLLFWMPTLASWTFADLRFYLGPGVNLGMGFGDHNNLGLGVEFPVGIGFQFNKVPIDLNIEAVPVIYLIDDVYFGIGGALNARYYF